MSLAQTLTPNSTEVSAKSVTDIPNLFYLLKTLIVEFIIFVKTSFAFLILIFVRDSHNNINSSPCIIVGFTFVILPLVIEEFGTIIFDYQQLKIL